ncbi:MAG: hypothetical protein FWG89_07545 [Treponema sp.]|nr:hypothetical protein [Treponema sp.]
MSTTQAYTLPENMKDNTYRAVASQADSPACFAGTLPRPPPVCYQADT